VYTSRHHYIKGIHEVERQRTFLSIYRNNINPAEQPHRRTLLSASMHRELLAEDSHYIMIAPGSVWNTKKWPQHHFKTLICALLENQSHSIMLIGSESDRALCESIIPETLRDRINNVAGTMTLDETLRAMKNAKYLIANDSAPIHLASLVNCPTIAIFGPTHPAFGFAPMSDVSYIMQKNMECRPCSIHGQTTCPLGTHACMEDILPVDVMQIAMKYFN
jgi:heptosyltransferase-2